MSDPAFDGRSVPEQGAAPADPDAVRGPVDTGPPGDAPSPEPEGGDALTRPRRRRGSRGGRNRSRSTGKADGTGSQTEEPTARADDAAPAEDAGAAPAPSTPSPRADDAADPAPGTRSGGRRGASRQPEELPERLTHGRARSADAAERALVRRPQIGDTRPAPAPTPATAPTAGGSAGAKAAGGSAGAKAGGGAAGAKAAGGAAGAKAGGGGSKRAGGSEAKKDAGGRARGQRRKRGGRGGSGDSAVDAPSAVQPVEALVPDEPFELDEGTLKRRKGRERKGRPVGRYLMCVSVGPRATQIAVLEGRNLIEHYVSRPADDVGQIHGNIYLGRVQNVLPGMEAAFVDIGTPKNAVLYRGDVQYDKEDIEEGGNARIEQILKQRQTILCQVTKNPIAHKGARLTQEVSLPGRFVVLIPNSTTYGISKRLPDDERKRLRSVLDRVRPKGHGLIVRTAAENVTAEEIERDVLQLAQQWRQVEALAASTSTTAPALLYREPDMAVRVIREEFNKDYRGIVIDDRALYEEIANYVNAISPALADRVQFYDPAVEGLSIFERHHVHEQLHKALDRKVWLPSGGSLVIEHTEALTVIDVNTGKNVGTSSLEETVFRNNLEAADEIARQLRLRDIGGIIVIDFIDMEIEDNRRQVIRAFRDALARDKTRTQVFDISDLGLVEMTRKRIGEGLLESFSTTCPECEGRGVRIDEDLIV
ncbi:MAG: Rne/Rng family ribonuclease [Acidimicrobiales bacterium]|jgi:ribonuclease E|nr:Rne/Rng family ribonuclease [Acidimicrobiales bacterium]